MSELRCGNSACENTFAAHGKKRYCSPECWKAATLDVQRQKRREWHAANRDKANAGRLARYLRDHEANKQKLRDSYQKFRPQRRAEGKAWFEAHRDEDNARRREHYHEHKDENRPIRRVKRHEARAALPWKKLLDAARGRSKKKRVPYALTDEWAEATWTGRCELTGVEFSVSMDGKPGGRSYSPSIDRKIPELGYVPDNCRFILYGINRFKGEITDDEMFKMAALLLKGR